MGAAHQHFPKNKLFNYPSQTFKFKAIKSNMKNFLILGLQIPGPHTNL